MLLKKGKDKFYFERKIFDLIYGEKTDLSVEHRDKPDFWVKNNSNEKFGVEITQLYSNESEARLQCIDNYTEELLDLKQYRHKDDIEKLGVHNIELISPNGKTIETSAIIQKLPTFQEYINKVSDCISGKNLLLDDYCKNLSYYNLIIYDYSSGLINLTQKGFYNAFYNDSIIKLILESRFREIFLITKFSENRLNLPLKRILLLSRIFLFQEVLKKVYPVIQEIPDSKYFDWFGEFLLSQGFKNVGLRKTNDEIEINYGNSGYLLKNGNSIVLRDYDCYEINKSEFHELKKKGFITNEITETIDSIYKTFGFACGLGMEIKKI